jgi:hypothetical protein
MTEEGFRFELDRDNKILTITGQEADLKQRIMNETEEMVRRT